MRGGLRFAVAVIAAGLALGPATALAQSAQETTNTPATDSVGPRELQNFSLPGTVTRPSEQPPAQRTTPPAPANRAPATQAAPAGETRTAAPARPDRPAPQPRSATAAASDDLGRAATPTPQPLRQTPPASSVTVALPSLGEATVASSSATTVPAAADFDAGDDAGAGNLAPEQSLLSLPWLLAALALGAGGAFLFWRSRSREAFAGGPRVDAFVAPQPAPAPAPAPPRARAPAPAPAPPRPAPAIPGGVVSTRLRPWLELSMQPLRCIVEDERVTIEFALDLYNSGSAPARAVLIEASLFNAGPNQDQEIGAFFANPVGEGDRIAAIAPLKRMTLRTQVATELQHIRVLQVGDRRVFVPLIAFNALYGWSGGEGQTSVSYLIGRDTKGEKMAPFRLDLGPRVFRGVGARPLPVSVRN